MNLSSAFSTKSTRIILIVSMPMFFAANCKDPCVKPFLDSEKCKALDSKQSIAVIAPTVELRVTDFQPDVVDAGVSFDATVYGKGFEEGAMILVGERNFATEFVSETELRIAVNPMDSGLYNVTVSNPTAQKHTLYEALQVGSLTDDGDLTARCEDVTLYFELNKDRLTAESERSVLEQSDCWVNSNVQLRLEGHCDERGTTEFNIALGQRRADAAARFLLTQGVADSNLKTVSHGEEKPAIQGSSEAAYQQNRRVEIIVQ